MYIYLGKSALLLQLVTGKFFQDYDPTIEDSYRKVMEVSPDQKVLLDIVDTYAEQEFVQMHEIYRREAQIPILCFAINDEDGLNECIKIFDRIMRMWEYPSGPHGDHFGRMGLALVGCKMDLYYGDGQDGKSISDQDKKIMDGNYERAVKLSEIWNIPFIETSAKECINVDACFRQIVYEYWLFTQSRTMNLNTDKHRDLYTGDSFH